MLLAIIFLIFALTLLAVGVNAIQQHKQRVELERRQHFYRHKTILDDTENLMVIVSELPLSKQSLHALRIRAHTALLALIDIQPETSDFKTRLADYEASIANFDPNDKSLLNQSFQVPDNDKQLITMIRGLKKLRQILRQEHGRNKIDSQSFHDEDKHIEKTLIRISAESLIRRGEQAYRSHMLGSARQYFEKGLITLQQASFSDDYIVDRANLINERLEDITESLKNAHAQEMQKKNQKSDLDELFQPKKKW